MAAEHAAMTGRPVEAERWADTVDRWWQGQDPARNRENGVPDVVAATLCERSMAAMTRRQWNQAEALANDATAVL